MRALFRVNGVSIDYLEMDYKRRQSLKQLAWSVAVQW